MLILIVSVEESMQLKDVMSLGKRNGIGLVDDGMEQGFPQPIFRTAGYVQHIRQTQRSHCL